MSYPQQPGWAPPMFLWNYKVAMVGGPPQTIEVQLQQIGAEGWELVTMWMTSARDPALSAGYFTAVFKRPYAMPR